MSFVCNFCMRPMPSGSAPIRVVLETRPREYAERSVSDEYNRRDIIDKGGVGNEIVEEACLCKRCHIKFTQDIQED